jgi:hypothetical protein
LSGEPHGETDTLARLRRSVRRTEEIALAP